ncbi:MAG: flagellar biosynthetic protein FliO [Myxococcota bacterium]
MIHWGLLLSVAHAEPAPPPAEVDVPAEPAAAPTLEERLLGEPPVDEPPAVEPLPVLDTFSWWPILLVAAGAGAVWWTRRRLEQKHAEDTGSELRVVGRAELGAQSGLAVVEVRDRNGAWRRLVIGTGDGTPALVADLGEPQFGLLGEDEDSTVEEVAPYTPPSAPDRSLGGDLPRDFDRYDPLPSPSEAGLPPLPADPKSGRALVHEVLGERRRKGRPARRSTSFHTFA